MLSQLTWLYSHSNKLPLRKSCIALPPDTIGKSRRRRLQASFVPLLRGYVVAKDFMALVVN
jgi:hypothetical protein